MNKISVIVPIYKVESYLNRCIDSILNQTYTDYELLLVDDGSPDNCSAICDKYAEKDNRIIVIHKNNGGLSDARNTGIDWCFQNSCSEWICFIDSDDWIHPSFLEIMYNMIIKNNVKVAVCDFDRVSEMTIFSKENFKVNKYDPLDLFVNYKTTATIACNKLYKKELFQGIRYPVGRLHEDEFTTHKILYLAGPVIYIRCPLYYYYYNETSIMHQDYSLRKMDAIDAFEEQQIFFKSIGRDDLVRQWDRNIQGAYGFHYYKLKENGYDEYAANLRRKSINHLKKMKHENNLKLFSSIDLYKPFYPLESKIVILILNLKKNISRSVLGHLYRYLKGHEA